MTLADRIGVMDRGRLVQTGSAAELYRLPANRFVAGLLGDVNLIEGRLVETGTLARVDTAIGPIRAEAGDGLAGTETGSAVVVALRPERVRIGLAAPESAVDNVIQGTIGDAAFLGDRVRRQIRMADGLRLRVSSALPEEASARVGDTVWLSFGSDAALVLPA